MHAPYCHLRPTQLYHIFPHCLIKDTIFEKVIKYQNCVLIFSKTLSETFLILRRIERDVIENVYCFFIVVPCILTTLKFFSPTNAPFYLTYI